MDWIHLARNKQLMMSCFENGN